MIGPGAAVTQLVDGGRIRGQEQRRDEARLREGPHPHVEPFQVDQHADDDVVARGGREERPVERRIVVDVVTKELAAVEFG